LVNERVSNVPKEKANLGTEPDYFFKGAPWTIDEPFAQVQLLERIAKFYQPRAIIKFASSIECQPI